MIAKKDMEIRLKDKSYVVGGYVLSNIASVAIGNVEFTSIEEFTGKAVKKNVPVHSLMIFGKSIDLPKESIGDPCDPNLWISKLFGLTAVFSENKESDLKGLLKYPFSQILVGSIIACNSHKYHAICSPQSNKIERSSPEKLCQLPDPKPYLEYVKEVFSINCERLGVKVPTDFPEPCVFLI